MTNCPIPGSDYEIRSMEFPHPAGTLESAGVPTEVTNWIDSHPVGTPVTGGTVDKMMPPIYLASIGTSNPFWITVYIVLVSRH